MRITIAAVGRLRAGPMQDLLSEYLRRLTWPHDVKEVEEKRQMPPEALKRREGELLLQSLPRQASVIALDGRGQSLTSEGFAHLIRGYRDAGTGDLAFLIGGAEGLSDQARAAAERRLAFGAMTWPHLLVRVMLAEQLYRAQSILTGHPYHRA
ncbi:MAG: 23S rRNA (pseudouridine(1915)-N(3))-methyltransferase RlmH [Kiloniellales bacterium]|nr:23S rRNA (pseudouridine(1915)-N(3))-methyltransferase RlmH [Kiloniellales bacterium]